MIVGRVMEKTTTTHFDFKINGDISKYDFVQVYLDNEGFILGQVIEIEARKDERIARVEVIGIIKEKLQPLTKPVPPEREVLKADKEALRNIIKKEGLLLGKIKNLDIDFYLSIEKVLTKHLSILAKTGAGKSYAAGVVIEELLKNNAPVIIIDPHNEYINLGIANNNPKELLKLEQYNLKPQRFNIEIYGDPTLNINAKKLLIPSKVTKQDLKVLLPKLTPTQEAILNEALTINQEIDILELRQAIELIENPAKNNLLSMIDYLLSLEIFSFQDIDLSQLVKPGIATIIALKGYPPEIQQIFVYKILSTLFNYRKKSLIPPFFLLIEEAHNFCPEKGFGESKSKDIIRTLASEGRKFGIGLGIISQRPARIDKTVLSQCNTNIILKVTNPNDLKSIISSLEGAYPGMEDLIKSLPIGNAIISGALDMPIIVEIRPRMTLHGGAINLGFIKVFKPNITKKDLEIIKDKKFIEEYIPAILVELESRNKKGLFLLSLKDKGIITNIDRYEVKRIPPLNELNSEEVRAIRALMRNSAINIPESLIEKGLVEKRDNEIVLSNNYIYDNPFKYVVKRKPFFMNINTETIDIDKQEVLSQLELIGNILRVEDCYVLRYKEE